MPILWLYHRDYRTRLDRFRSESPVVKRPAPAAAEVRIGRVKPRSARVIQSMPPPIRRTFMIFGAQVGQTAALYGDQF